MRGIEQKITWLCNASQPQLFKDLLFNLTLRSWIAFSNSETASRSENQDNTVSQQTDEYSDYFYIIFSLPLILVKKNLYSWRLKFLFSKFLFFILLLTINLQKFRVLLKLGSKKVALISWGSYLVHSGTCSKTRK